MYLYAELLQRNPVVLIFALFAFSHVKHISVAKT